MGSRIKKESVFSTTSWMVAPLELCYLKQTKRCPQRKPLCLFKTCCFIVWGFSALAKPLLDSGDYGYYIKTKISDGIPGWEDEIPPWGALRVQRKNMESAPVTAEPAMIEGITSKDRQRQRV